MKTTEKEKERICLRPPPVCHVQQTHPWLLMCHGRDLQRHTFYNISEDRYYTRTIPELKNKRIWASFYGWLLADDSEIDDSFLFNPITLGKIQLPPIKEYRACILSKPPTDPDCHLLFFAQDHLVFCKPGDDKFAEQSSHFGNDRLVAATNCRGKIYGLTIRNRTTVTIDFVDSAVQVQPLMDKTGKPLQVPLPPRLKTRLGQDFLIESDGRLLLIRKVISEFLPMDFSEFSVCRVDTSEMTYHEVTNLGEHAIFLGLPNGIACSTTEQKIKKNCVYFFREDDRNLYVYDLEERSKTILLPCPNVSRVGTISCWVMMPNVA